MSKNKTIQAEFISSRVKLNELPEASLPEIAFIGRSNVGKSSLINCLTEKKDLAKTSSTPGKTQTINHFKINNLWYLVDLPGYGFAKVAKDIRDKWDGMIKNYLLKRENLQIVFVLVDSRLEAQKSDIDFINWLGENGIPLAIIFTKTDKLGKTKIQQNMAKYKKKMQEVWDELPEMFISSAETKNGKEIIMEYIEGIVNSYDFKK